MNDKVNQQREISVVMPTYNGARWLHQAIDSVLSQTYENFELLLIDDGSSDATKDIITEYQKKDSRIKSVFKSHTGATDSQNVGINMASGNWIARCDQDDICEPERLAIQLNFVTENPGVDLIGSGFTEIDENGHIVKVHRYSRCNIILGRNLETLKRFFPHSSAFYKREAAKRLGGYNIRFTRADDWDLWLRLSEQGRIACLPEPLVRIRKHSGQMSLFDNNRRSFFDSTSASICHFMRIKGFTDIPSMDKDEGKWNTFLSWAEKRILESGVITEREIWMDARTEYFNSSQDNKGKWQLFLCLVKSGRFVSIITHKIFGLSLPEKLAGEWILIKRIKNT